MTGIIDAATVSLDSGSTFGTVGIFFMTANAENKQEPGGEPRGSGKRIYRSN
jgi:hypothetical protein